MLGYVAVTADFTAAVFGLVGVVVGGVITATSSYVLAVRSERRAKELEGNARRDELRTGARLLSSDLINGEVSVGRTSADRKFYRLVHDSLAADCWDAYNETLATTLSTKDWDRVVMGVGSLRQVKVLRGDMLRQNTPDIDAADAEEGEKLLVSLQADMNTAGEVLSRLT